MSRGTDEQAILLVKRDKQKRQLRWLEQWDLSNIVLNHIELSSSSATVSLPLVDVVVSPTLRIGLATGYHSQGASTNQQSGNGWKIQNDIEYITLDHKGSIFPKDEEYHLTSHGQTFLFKRSSQGLYVIEGEDDVRVHHDRKNQRWIIETPNVRSIYGRPENQDFISESFQWSLRWEHWRGPGRDENGLQREVVAWYLVSREENFGAKKKLYYEYIHEEKQLQLTNMGYTSVILLKTIRDSKDNFRLDFHYGQKSNREFTGKQYKDAEGIIEFPIPLLSKYFLQGCKINTPTYTQDIKLEYSVVNKNKTRLFTGLTQIFTTLNRTLISEPLIHFEYAETDNLYLLRNISIPSLNSTVVYSYAKTKIPPLKFKTESLNTYRYPATEKVQMEQGVDYGVMSFDLGIGDIFLRIFNRHFTHYHQEISTCSHSKHGANYKFLDSEDPDGIKQFASILYRNMLAVLIETRKNKSLFVFHKTTNATNFPDCPTSTFIFSPKALFRYSDSLMVISENRPEKKGELHLIVPNEEGVDTTNEGPGYTTTTVNLIKNENRDITRMGVQGDVIFAYNGELLYGIRKNENEEWHTSVIAEISSNEHEIFEYYFHVPEEFKELILPQIQTAGLRTVGNMVLLSTISYEWSWFFPSLVTSCHLLLLDESLIVKSSLKHTVKTEVIAGMTFKDEQPDGNTLHFGYKFQPKHESILTDITGKLDEELLEAFPYSPESRQKAKDEIIEDLNKENERIFKEMVLFDPNPFVKFNLDAKRATASNTTLEMTGNGWQTKPKSNSSSFLLGNSFVLKYTENEKDSKVAYTLYGQDPFIGGATGNILSSFEISTNFGNLAYGYPGYVGVHSFGTDSVYLITLPEEGESCYNITVGERGEQLLSLSNPGTLFTIRNSTDPSLFPFNKELIVRRVNSILSSSSLWTVSKTEISHGNEKRTRTLENVFFSNDTCLSQVNSLRITPAGNASLFGFYEEKTEVPIEVPENMTSSQIWYDNSGNIVLSKFDPDTPKEVSSDEKWYTIFDSYGQKEIVDISPYNVTEKIVSHLGFEIYENNTHPWRYNVDGVLSNSMSLTGHNVLRLQETDRLQASFTPSRQYELMIASAWVRFVQLDAFHNNATYKFGAPAPFFTAKLKTNKGHDFFTITSQMKKQKGSWVYLEILIDLEGIRQNAYAELYRHSDEYKDLAPPSQTNFTIVLEINRGTNDLVDVDHIRFYPSQLDLSSKVYDSENGLEVQRILSDGEILRKLYDVYGKEIGVLGEDNQIENFRSGTLSGSIALTNQNFRGASEQFMKTEIIFQPEGGIYETFDEFSRSKLWQIEELVDENWTFSKGTIEHNSNKSHRIIVKTPELLFDPASSTIRFYVDVHSANSELSISLHNLKNVLTILSPGTITVGENCSNIYGLPSMGEVIMHIEEQTAFIWFDGVLIFDRRLNRECLPNSYIPGDTPWSEFYFNVTGSILISQLITLRRPKITVDFLNAWGDRTQVLQLINVDNVLVHETIYDELGRDAIKTKTAEITRVSEFTSLLRYYPEFVTNRNPSDHDSIFATAIVKGLLNETFPLDEGYPYFRTVYHKDMLRDAEVESMPGKSFSVNGQFVKREERWSSFPFLEVLFPRSNGFKQRVLYEPNGSVKVTVIDTKDNEVANYVKVLGHEDTLAITEYDDDGNIVKLLPPNYHQVMGTLINRTIPWSFGDDNLSTEENHWQNLLGTHSKYKNKNMIERKSPDIGTQGYMYDITGKMKFMYRVNFTKNELGNDTKVAQDIIYMLNDESPHPVVTGLINEHVMLDSLYKYTNDTSLPYKGTVYQRIINSVTHSDPSLRRKVRLIITYDELDDNGMNSAIKPPIQEILKFSTNNQVLMKTTNALRTKTPTSYRKHYKRDMLKEISYPNESEGLYNDGNFNLLQSHDKIGRVVGIGTRENATRFATFRYNSNGQVIQEVVDGVILNLDYISPGLLTKTSDNNLAQALTFTEGGYGQDGFGDGIVMSNIMNASWTSVMDAGQRSWFSIPKESFQSDITMTMCMNALIRKGFIDEQTLIPKKFVTHEVISQIPLSCAGSLGHRIMKLVARHIPPSNKFGHVYTYGNHQELTKAKFISDSCENTNFGPLQLKSFSKFGSELAEKVWDSLVKYDYILMRSSNPQDKMAAVGKQGSQPIFRLSQLQEDLLKVAAVSGPFTKNIMNYMYEAVTNQSAISDIVRFQELYIEWWGYLDTPNVPIIIKNRKKQEAASIYNMLQQKGYLSGNLNSLLTQEYMQKLDELDVDKVQTTNILTSHFRSQLGLNVYDYESYRIDPNGNQKMYYVGFNKHEIQYISNTNKVSRLLVQDPYALPGQDETTYKFTHDSNGNVNYAEHRGILKIKYHPITNRPTFIEMQDGRRIVYKYDSQAERILKRVFNANLTLVNELRYVRDERGLVLLDKQTTFDASTGRKVNEVTTTYIYGPRKSILGFIRNGKFYTVFTDHAGSTRLITQNGRVVAGYDYWPYGEAMKAFGEADSQLRYRFTGQEFDEETGLYNYHARLYDPLICRFLQPDPKSQFYSPYVYGANTPVSLVDPDGEFFLELFMIIGFIVGAYLAGASVNNSFNPAKWNWKSANTYIAMLAGGIGGAMMPYGFSGLGLVNSILVGFVGFVGSFVKLAVDFKSWDVTTWDYSTPKFWNSFFEGFGYGVNTLTMGVKNVYALSNIYKQLGTLGRIVLVGASITAGAGYAFLKGAFYAKKTGQKNPFEFWHWDISDPAVLQSIFDGFGMGLGFVKNSIQLVKLAKLQKDGLKDMIKDLSAGNKEFVKDILKENSKLIMKTIAKGIITVTAALLLSMHGNEEFNLAKWDWTSLSTYENFVNDLFTGYSLANFLIQTNHFKPTKEAKSYWATTKQEFIDAWKTNSYTSPGSRPLLKHFGIEDDVKLLMEEFVGGSSFITAAANSISSFIDCKAIPSENRADELMQCQAFLGSGRQSRQNQETINRFFKPSSLYQSKLKFVPVQPTNKQVELAQQLLFQFQQNKFDDSFIQSFFLGSIYHSFESIHLFERNLTSKSLHYCLDVIKNFDIPLVHTSLLSKDEESFTLRTRTVLTSTTDKFEAIKDQLVDSIKTLRFECMLDSSRPEDLKIQSEFLAVLSSSDETQLHTFTPSFIVNADPCSPQHVKFSQLPKTNSLNEHVFKLFDSETSSFDRKNQLDTILNITVSSFKRLQNDFLVQGFDSPIILGFMQGILASNFQATYQLILQPSSHTNARDNLVVLNKLNTAGLPVFNSVPLIFNFLHDPYMPTDNSTIYTAVSLSVSPEVLTADINPQDETSTILVYEAVPKFTGMFANAFTRDAIILRELLKYIYFTHINTNTNMVLKSSDEKNDNPRFVSSFILGELLSRISDPKFEIYLLVPTAQDDPERFLSQRFIFIKNVETQRCSILNIIESSFCTDTSCIFDPSVPMDIPAIPEIDISFLQMIEVHLNPKSKIAWSFATSPPNGQPEETFFQDLKIRTLDFNRVPKDSTRFLKLGPVMEPPNFEKFSFKKEFLTKLFDILQTEKLSTILTNKPDFQSVYLGLLMGASRQVNPDLDGLGLHLLNFATPKLSTGFIPDLPTLSLLSMMEDEMVVPQSEQVLASSLKLTNLTTEILEKMNESSVELKDFYCSQEEAIQDVFRFTQVPAVYCTGDISETPEVSRFTFHIEPEAQFGLNCSAPENPFEKYLRQGPINPNMYPSTNGNQYAEQNEAVQPTKNARLENCQPGAWLDGQYSHDGITCSSGKSKVAVFRKIMMDDVIPLSSASNPFNLLADNYDQLKCTSLEFNNVPSVACEGDKSYLIYSPYNQPKIFDELDGNLMLGRVAVNMLGKAWSFVRGKWSGNGKFDDMTHLVSEDMLGVWQHDIGDIRNLLGTLEGESSNIDWARVQLVELENELEEIKESGYQANVDKIEEILERVEAFKEDLAEQILYAKMSSLFSDGKEELGSDRTAYYKHVDKEETVGIGNVYHASPGISNHVTNYNSKQSIQ